VFWTRPSSPHPETRTLGRPDHDVPRNDLLFLYNPTIWVGLMGASLAPASAVRRSERCGDSAVKTVFVSVLVSLGAIRFLYWPTIISFYSYSRYILILLIDCIYIHILIHSFIHSLIVYTYYIYILLYRYIDSNSNSNLLQSITLHCIALHT